MTRPPLRIGNLNVEPPVVLAPMAGYTDSAMRSLCMNFGCGMTFTEVTNAEGIVRGSRRTLHMLETSPAERPLGAHLYGSNPESMAAAAAAVEKLGRFDCIDINCGCPVRKIVAKGAGAALMKSPERMAAIVGAVRAAVALPVTVKTRIGLAPDKVSILENLRAVEEAGAAAISIHCRFASNQHRGKADWDLLALVKRQARIPVIGNGGVDRAGDALEMFARTGVDAVMIGRAAVGNPWIFAQVGALLSGEPVRERSLSDLAAIVAEHLRRLTVLKEIERGNRRAARPAETSAVLLFRGHLYKYLSGLRGWGEVRRGLSEMKTPGDVMAAVDRVIREQRADG